MPHNNDKKRTNVSRACDQCRRKKIKCDRNQERNICTSCQRNGERCKFERVPLKRGPSKGAHKASDPELKLSSNKPSKSSLFEDSNSIIRPKSVGEDSNMDPLSRHGSNTPILDNNSNSGINDRNMGGIDDRLGGSTDPGTPSRSGSILLPPLGQYPQQQNYTNNSTSASNNMLNSTSLNSTILQQQQPFWKVPYHEFQNQRRGSIESLQSDLSVRTFNPQDQLVYNTFQQSPIAMKHSSDPTNSIPPNTKSQHLTTTSNIGSVVGANDLLSGNPNYWGSVRAGSFIPNGDENDDQIPQNLQRRSSSIPSILRNTSTSILLSQPQLPHPTNGAGSTSNNFNNTNDNSNLINNKGTGSTAGLGNNIDNAVGSASPQAQRQSQQLYSYSQFLNQSKPYNNQNFSSFGQFSTNGFQSRHGSITSEAMSPSTALGYNQNNSNNLPGANNPNISDISLLPNKESDPRVNDSQKVVKTEVSNDIFQFGEQNLANTIESNADKSEDKVKSGGKKGGKVPRKRKTKQVKESNKKLKVNKKSNFDSDSINSPKVPTPVQQIKTGFQYGQILDVELIDLYYEFIHVGFPVIPLNKQTLTNDILLVNTHPYSNIHEVNSYVILWFRNSLELLVRVALKRKNDSPFFDSHNTPGPLRSASGDENMAFNDTPKKKDITSSHADSISSGDDNGMAEVQSAFISALNECFQRVVDIHPKVRENKDRISPKIKIIYLTTFILLNYILALVGYDNSFVLGMSVTIFNEFKLYKLLVLPYKAICQDSEFSFNAKQSISLDDDFIENKNIGNGNGNRTNGSTPGEPNNDEGENALTNFNPSKEQQNSQKGGSGEGNENQGNQIRSKIGKAVNIEEETETNENYTIMFKRLYILLTMFDSLQSCLFGGPKLLNVCITNTTEKFFSGTTNSKWNIEDSLVREKGALISLKLGETLSEIASNRIIMNHFDIITLTNNNQANATDIVFNLKKLSNNRDYDNFLQENKGLELFDQQPLCISQLFHKMLIMKSSFTYQLLSLMDANNGNFVNMDLKRLEQIVESLCSLISVILQLLTLIMRLNPTNSIDLNYRPVTPTQRMEDMLSNKNTDSTDSISNSNKTNSGNDFYRRLLGLEHSNDIVYSDISRGVISPFAMAILHESHNIHELIKMTPTILIRVVMTLNVQDDTGNSVNNNATPGDHEEDMKLKRANTSQDLVYKLSNSMNDVVQIASLLSMIKPLKLFDHGFKTFESEDVLQGNDEDAKKRQRPVLKRLFYDTTNVPKPEAVDPLVVSLVNTGWNLLDDMELGFLPQ
ncbi:RGT1 [Nakaseomyces glabratus]|uniref:Glucose transport transcription regulator RGT1 n=1 Tax=Candida glabrata (strain ATCC 2001 / BCRC 20586 / JCM 3761 / NBRC 0622 / NRRL Y-65 / CBS 138) TaxID=284593 RepID=RGT1_CANGA|nr:uncharacterized protein CAGL0L01903g [Nakaseomyces glabratus]Q6FLP2.1 RecName: Full=Glucose transport transcription regulator RGT1; AltName: Full=Restores glucose transport protein 1 [Nakaseomyces glabratus CBS 138]KAH7595331.1 Zn(2)-C6 fungal-type DNA-binding domain profile [Nakaseomyces glabratus]KAH7601763.1 Zn(2)-C6 fungal-type DNA-binding domain profile [Nakaseomyces glabratus]QHS68520.1 RGT1 [Nakaseomyces glabratus]CAG61822.1 unnamed protein product [Nakaseomyces glabratus]|eukprot:XP_448852.1 uncharacterized protein CAGL0L01903g [[Candida] glabrata]